MVSARLIRSELRRAAPSKSDMSIADEDPAASTRDSQTFCALFRKPSQNKGPETQ
jgi:hypothetical protein